MKCPECKHRFEETYYITGYDEKGDTRNVEDLKLHNLRSALNSIEYMLQNWAVRCVLMDINMEIIKEFKKNKNGYV